MPEPQPEPTPVVPHAEPALRRPNWDEEAAERGRPFLVRHFDMSPGYGQIYVSNLFGDVFDDHENVYLVALDDAVDSRRFVGVVDRALIDVLIPGWGQPNTPFTVEVWPDAPPDDLDWDHEVDVDLDVSGTLLIQGSGGTYQDTTMVPAGEFRARISGRGYDEAAIRDGGGAEVRIRLWRREGTSEPNLRRSWPGFESSYPRKTP